MRPHRTASPRKGRWSFASGMSFLPFWVKRSSAVASALVLLLALPARAPAGTAPSPGSQPILAFLNQAIRWYRQQAALGQLTADPADVVFADATRRQAREVLQQAFVFARAYVALQPDQPAPAPQGAAPTNVRSLSSLAAEASSRAAAARGEVDALQRRLDVATGRRRSVLERQLAEARSELELAQARRDTLQTFLDFVQQTGGPTGAAGLLGQIDELQRSVPEASPQAPTPAPARAADTSATRRGASTGIAALAGDLFSLLRKMREVHDGLAATTELRGTVDRLRAPLMADMRDTLRRGDDLSKAPDTSDAAVLQQRTRDIDQLTSHFKKVSAAVVPLGKQAVLLDAHEATLSEWHGSADEEYDRVFRGLALRLGLLAVAIAAVLAASGFWRRATFRYVHDLRRRQQSLLIRRIVVVATVALMIVF